MTNQKFTAKTPENENTFVRNVRENFLLKNILLKIRTNGIDIVIDVRILWTTDTCKLHIKFKS